MRFAGYIRQSLNDKSSSSPAWQAQVIQNWITEHEHILIHTYTDIGGKRSDDTDIRTRPDFNTMMKLAATRQLGAEGIVVASQERFGTPDFYTFVAYLHSLRQAGIQLWDASKNSLLNPPGSEASGIMLSTIGSILDTGEQSSRSQRVVNGQIAKVKRYGAYLGGRLTYGTALRCITPPIVTDNGIIGGQELWRCEVIGKKRFLKCMPDGREIVMDRLPSGDRGDADLLVVCPSKFPDRLQAVKLIFTRYNQGAGCNQIAAELNQKGYKTQYGGLFYVSFVDWILKWGHVLTGRVAYGRSGVGKYWQHGAGTKAVAVDNLTGTRTRKSPDQWLISDAQLFEPIITPAVWQQAQELRAMRTGHHKRPRRPTAAYTGMLTCAHCGRTMTANCHQGVQLYQCTTYIAGGGRASGCHLNTIRQTLLDTWVDRYLTDVSANLSWATGKAPIQELYAERQATLQAIPGLRKAIETYLYEELAQLFDYKQAGRYRIFQIKHKTVKLPGYSGDAYFLQEIADWVESCSVGATKQKIAELTARRTHLLDIYPETATRSIRERLATEVEQLEAQLSRLQAGLTGHVSQYRLILRQLTDIWRRAKTARATAVPLARRNALLQVISEIKITFEQVAHGPRMISRPQSITIIPQLGDESVYPVSMGSHAALLGSPLTLTYRLVNRGY